MTLNGHRNQNDVQGAILVILLVVVVFGCLLVAGGFYTWRSINRARMVAMEAELAARMEADRTRQIAQPLVEQQGTLDQQQETARQTDDLAKPMEPPSDLVVYVDGEANLQVAGQPMQLEQLEQVILGRVLDNRRPKIRLVVSPRCKIGEIGVLLSMCQKLGETMIEVTGESESAERQ